MSPLEHMARVLHEGEKMMRPNHPRIVEAIEDRQHRERRQYIDKFEAIFEAIGKQLALLDGLALYDTAARCAHNGLKDALSDARWTIKSNAE